MVFREDYENNDNDNADSHDERNDDDEIDYYDNGKGDNDEGNTEMDGNDVNDDDAHLYDDDCHCYYDDESYCFRYQIMRNCWQEEPDDRPSFEQLQRELKLMENQHKVIKCSHAVNFVHPHPFQHLSNLLRFVIFLSQRLINMKDYDTKLYENVEDLMS